MPLLFCEWCGDAATVVVRILEETKGHDALDMAACDAHRADHPVVHDLAGERAGNGRRFARHSRRRPEP